MPSTTLTVVSMPLASSIVITPSFFTLPIASAIILPMKLSLLAEIVATCSIFSMLSPTCFDCAFSDFTTSMTALSIPRFRSIGLAPAVTFFSPVVKIDWARTVAVVVPSPAISLVLEATSLTIWAPMFATGSFSSISFATVTPSLVITGDPYDLSIITLRPLGPRVTFTALERASTPSFSASLAFMLKKISFAILLLIFGLMNSVKS